MNQKDKEDAAAVSLVGCGCATIGCALPTAAVIAIIWAISHFLMGSG